MRSKVCPNHPFGKEYKRKDKGDYRILRIYWKKVPKDSLVKKLNMILPYATEKEMKDIVNYSLETLEKIPKEVYITMNFA